MESERFVALFHEAYLAFHRRSGRRGQLTNASRSVLLHLAQAGPLSIGEAARHLDRAQSVVSDIVAQLEDKGLLERERDPSNGRRTLVWLTRMAWTGCVRTAPRSTWNSSRARSSGSMPAPARVSSEASRRSWRPAPTPTTTLGAPDDDV